MPINRNTLMRIKTIDDCLCRRQRRWTLEDLRQACADALYDYEGIDDISLRTIQRDIELMRSDKLGYCAPIIVVERKYYTYEDPNYSITRLPLSESDLAELSSAIDIIKHYQGFKGMAGQEDILARMQDRLRQQTDNRQIVYIDTNTRLKGIEFLGKLYDHISRKEPIRLVYRSFKSTREKEYFLSPYILKEFNNRWFLIAYNKRNRDMHTVPLDRIVSVCKDEKGIYEENTFVDIDKYLGEMVGVTRDIGSVPQLVTIKVDASPAPYIITKPFHQSQQVIETHQDGSVTIQLNVIINHELTRLLLGYGNYIEVVSPKLLRQEMANALIMGAAKYQQ